MTTSAIVGGTAIIYRKRAADGAAVGGPLGWVAALLGGSTAPKKWRGKYGEIELGTEEEALGRPHPQEQRHVYCVIGKSWWFWWFWRHG